MPRWCIDSQEQSKILSCRNTSDNLTRNQYYRYSKSVKHLFQNTAPIPWYCIQFWIFAISSRSISVRQQNGRWLSVLFLKYSRSFFADFDATFDWKFTSIFYTLTLTWFQADFNKPSVSFSFDNSFVVIGYDYKSVSMQFP